MLEREVASRARPGTEGIEGGLIHPPIEASEADCNSGCPDGDQRADREQNPRDKNAL